MHLHIFRNCGTFMGSLALLALRNWGISSADLYFS